MTDWTEKCYMSRKGAAKGKPSKKHELTVEKQGKYHPYASLVLTIEPGDIVIAETRMPLKTSSKARATSHRHVGR